MPGDNPFKQDSLERIRVGGKYRLPDQCYTTDERGLPGARVDTVAITTIEDFQKELDSLEQIGASGFDYFLENAARQEYFRKLGDYAQRLGLHTALNEIISRRKSLFEKAKNIFQRIQDQQAVENAEIEKVVQDYTAFLNEIKSLFEDFRSKNPETL